MTGSETVQHPFDALRGEQFVVLTTYRRSGDAMPTAVWFAERGGKVYVTTNSESGKVKRIRNDARVVLAASDRAGVVHGAPIEAQARVLPVDESVVAQETLRAKYGAMYDQVTAQMDASGRAGQRVFLEVMPR